MIRIPFALMALLPLLAAAAPPVDFNREIRPLLNARCIKCHGGVHKQGGVSFQYRAEAVKPAESGVLPIVPGTPGDSAMLARVRHPDPAYRMPPEGEPLTAEQIDRLARWIGEGAPYVEHWAFVPPQPYPGTDIDSHIQARLQQAGLEAVPEADRPALIRRLSLDLTGLPPTPEETAAFLADAGPDAYERLVDRLLASPQYGERWAAMWLDLARYSDSQGYEKDANRVIWRYRDWVIDAFNQDMPYDQFIIEQLAGDLLPEPSTDQFLATAFHRNTMTNDEGGTDDEEFRVAAVVDRVNVTWDVFMGVTFSCVQCHDHPYDPFRHEEYFQQLAFLNNTVDSDKSNDQPRLATPAKDHAQRLDTLNAEYARLRERLARRPENATPVTGRFVRIDLPGSDRILSLAEVQVFGGDTNLALEGEAMQSSTDFRSGPGLAIDGNTNGDFDTAKSTTHTETESAPWWELDLGDELPLDRVVVWNRTGANLPERLNGFHLSVLHADRSPAWRGENLPAPGQQLELALIDGASEILSRMATLQADIAALKPVTTPVMRELPEAERRKTHVFLRGNWMTLGDEVEPGVPEALHPFPMDAPRHRLGLAQWIAARDNPLTARVMVNRSWEQLFGTGLVETVEDLGTQGAPPSHPELLDMLAVRFMDEDGWSVKKLIRRMVLSDTYRRSSTAPAAMRERDPRGELLAWFPRVRLSAEQIRDQALAVGGLLSTKMYGPSVMPPQPQGVWQTVYSNAKWETSPGEDRYRRALYTYWKRTSPYPSMISFDAGSRELCLPRRIRTNTPLQALVTLNDPVYVEAAQALAGRMERDGGPTLDTRLRHGFRLSLARDPTVSQLSVMTDLYHHALAEYQQDLPLATDLAGTPELAALTVVASAFLNLDEAITKN